MKFRPCFVSFEGVRYHVAANGEARLAAYFVPPSNVNLTIPPVAEELAARIRSEASRLRRNRASRARYSAMRSIGMVRTPYGWE